VVPQGIAYISQRVPKLIEDASEELPGAFQLLIQRLLKHLEALQQQVDEIETQIKAWHRASEASQRLEKVPGIGPLTATALVASVGDARNFDSGSHRRPVRLMQFRTRGRPIPTPHGAGGRTAVPDSTLAPTPGGHSPIHGDRAATLTRSRSRS